VEPVSVDYRGYRVHECPPNGQGLAALLALQTFRELAPEDEAQALHAKVEAMRLGFADAARLVADPEHATAPLEQLLGEAYALERASSISMDRRMAEAASGYVSPGGAGDDTVYFCAVDEHGNGCSFINSNYMGFGTGIVPRGCGFSIQNRGRGFVLTPGHPNVLAPRKRPYHTIIPGLVTETATDGREELAAVFGVMGGMMQPQGHVQVVTSLIDDGYDPQSALDAPRFCLENGEPEGTLLVEDDMPPELRDALEQRGHRTELVTGARRSVFGLGQIIARCGETWWSGSDPRGDGHAAGF
jgi:gamma-glutamyltranspeptidase/glutathione hydrolase